MVSERRQARQRSSVDPAKDFVKYSIGSTCPSSPDRSSHPRLAISQIFNREHLHPAVPTGVHTPGLSAKYSIGSTRPQQSQQEFTLPPGYLSSIQLEASASG